GLRADDGLYVRDDGAPERGAAHRTKPPRVARPRRRGASGARDISRGRQRAPVRVDALSLRAALRRRARAEHGAPRRTVWPVAPGAAASAHRDAPRDDDLHGADDVRALAEAARGGPQALLDVVAAARHARRR